MCTEAVPKWSHVMSVMWLRTDQVRSTVRVSARAWFQVTVGIYTYSLRSHAHVV